MLFTYYTLKRIYLELNEPSHEPLLIRNTEKPLHLLSIQISRRF